MADSGSGRDSCGKREAEREDAQWAIRHLLLAMARDVLEAAEAEKHSRPYQVGHSPFNYWWLRTVAGDLVRKVESESGSVYRTEVSPYMLKMAQTVLEILDGKELEEASTKARELWGDTSTSVRAYAPSAVEEIQNWLGSRVIEASTLEDVIFVLRERLSPGLSAEEFIATFEARHENGPDYRSWQRLQRCLGMSEEKIAQLIARRRSEDKH